MASHIICFHLIVSLFGLCFNIIQCFLFSKVDQWFIEGLNIKYKLLSGYEGYSFCMSSFVAFGYLYRVNLYLFIFKNVEYKLTKL